MCSSVTPVKESRLIIWDPPKTCNPWAFQSGNGKTSAWTSFWVCLAPRMGITRYVSSWTAWLSRPTSYPYPLHIESDSMPSSACHTLSAITASRRQSSLTEDLSLLIAFMSNYMSVWAPISFEDQRITPRLMDRLSESIKSLKICFVLVFWRMVWNGTSTFH
jgi:hypothetical protein